MLSRLKTKNLRGISALLFYVFLLGIVGTEFQKINISGQPGNYEVNTKEGEVLSEETSVVPANRAVRTQNSVQLRSAIRSSRINNQKRVVLPFTAKGCTKKSLGDANCDDSVNRGDYILWELEDKREKAGKFNIARKHADFNKDGKVNSKDYSIWQSNSTSLSSTITQEVKDRLAHLIRSVLPKLEVFAQETSAGGDGSYAATLPDGSSKLVNPTSDGGYTITNLDSNNNPVSTKTYSRNGTEVSNTYYDGTDASTRIKSGNQVLIVNKSIIDEVVVETIGDSITQLWPTQESFNRGDTPQTVSLPTSEGSTLLSLQANNAGLMKQTDGNGKLNEETKMLGDGRIISVNNKYKMTVEANGNNGFVSIRMENSLGGSTDYLFHSKYGLVSITQTAKDKKAYFATSKNKNAKEWELTIIDKDGKKDTKTVEDPIKETGSNTPSPLDLLKETNDAVQRAFVSSNSPFTEAFSDSKVQAKAADKILAAKGGSSSVLGVSIVKDAFADSTGGWIQSKNGDTWETRKEDLPDGGTLQITRPVAGSVGHESSINEIQIVGYNALGQREGDKVEVKGTGAGDISFPESLEGREAFLDAARGATTPEQIQAANQIAQEVDQAQSGTTAPPPVVGGFVGGIGTGGATQGWSPVTATTGPYGDISPKISYEPTGQISITSAPTNGSITTTVYSAGTTATPRSDGSGWDVAGPNGVAASVESTAVSVPGVGSGWTDMDTGVVSIFNASGVEVAQMSWDASINNFSINNITGDFVTAEQISVGAASYSVADMADNGVADQSVGSIDTGYSSPSVAPGPEGGGGGQQPDTTSDVSYDSSAGDYGGNSVDQTGSTSSGE
jgi:hypothetical protein